MHDLILLQKWLYGGMGEGLRAASDIGALPVMLASAVLFGMVHALMPGHGKSVLVSYHLGRPGRLLDGLVTGTLLSLTHIGMAVVLVFAGVAVISRSVAVGGRTPAFETASGALIVLTGAFLLWRALRNGHEHSQGSGTRDGRMLAVVTGLIPCPLTTFILTYALARGIVATGLAAVAAMAVGVIITIAGFAVAAVLMRGRVVAWLARTEGWRQGLGRTLEICGALAVLLFGVAMLAGRVTP